VHASDEQTNLKSECKRDLLIARFGAQGFDYVGDAWADLPVWEAARRCHVVDGSKRLLAALAVRGKVPQSVETSSGAPVAALFRTLRPHQWTKNLLVVLPLLTAHQYGALSANLHALLALIAFCLTASAMYLLNDLLDVQDDRHHASKRRRPLAAGELSLLAGWLSWPLLLGSAFGLAFSQLPPLFYWVLLGYFALAFAYSYRLKRIAIVDVMTLAALYTLRIIAGAMAIGVPPSFWLLSFSMFLFLSLACIKRASELRLLREANGEAQIRGRGYHAADLELISMLGIAAGYLSVLVLALYVQEPATAVLYHTPELIWLACPLLLYWVSRAWLKTHRGQMHDDPILFALRDRASWAVAGLLITVFGLARLPS
jgi:4-hydroxybenzoate polyprenyltransferase